MDDWNAKDMEDIFQYRWGWKCEWYGWRRVLWLAVAIDFRLQLVYIVLFGFALSYGRHLVESDLSTFTAMPHEAVTKNWKGGDA